MRGKILLLFTLLLIPGAFASTYYLQILNPNDYDLSNFQVKVNLSTYGISPPISQVSLPDGTTIPFCYEQPNGECNQTESNIIWVKVPHIPKKDYILIKLTTDGSNGAVSGDQVFDFYDDFNGNELDTSKWAYQQVLSYTISDGLITIAKGGISALVGDDLREGYVIESRLNPIQDAAAHYSGTIAVTSDRDGDGFTENMNAGADATILFMLGENTDDWGDWIGSGASSSYDIDNPTATGWIASATHNKWYRNKLIVKQGYVKLVVGDDDESIIAHREIPHAVFHYAMNKLTIGSFCGDCGDPSYDYFVDTTYDWVRVRKYADQDPIVKQAYARSSLSPQSPSPTQSEYSQTYRYVRQVTLLPENLISVSNAQVILTLDTQSLISDGKMKSDCSDIYITYYDPLYGELPAKFWVDPTTCNSKTTRIYVKLPTISINNDWILNVYYGSPDAIPVWDPKNTFVFYVDLSNPSDINNNLIIRSEGSTSISYTPNGLQVNTGSDGRIVIINK